MSNYLFSMRRRVTTSLIELACVASIISVLAITAAASQQNIIGPVGSVQFGRQVVALSNGNIVVIDPSYSPGTILELGAVYLYNGTNGALISMMTGSNEYDELGSAGITVLANGNYVVVSPRWDNGTIHGAGAVTWCSKTTGCPTTISASNSLVGSSINDYIGTYNDPFPSANLTPLSNGNYVIGSYLWDNNGNTDVGAVTFANGDGSTVGPVSIANSIIGSNSGDYVGSRKIKALANGNYVASSPRWNNGLLWDVGAVTFGNGATGITGVVSSTNSLIGSKPYDGVNGVTALANGNYVVRCDYCDNGSVQDVGAVTFANGITGITGPVSAGNSLFGSTFNDSIGYGGVTALNNGNYVVRSDIWDNGSAENAGAITFGNGTVGVTGVVSPANSLVGSTTDDEVGRGGITPLTNGNYVISSPSWDSSTSPNTGAVTFADGTSGISGTISASNSLMTSSGAIIGYGGVTALTNGNYVVSSPIALSSLGAVTFGNGNTGVVGNVTTSNSLVGSTTGDRIGNGVVTALTNGNYVINSSLWDNGSIVDAGAATLGDGTNGTVGHITTANSLVGMSTNDRVGLRTVALTNGNYVVVSSGWDKHLDSQIITDAGAVTYGNGTSGITGPISSANSLVGSSPNDLIGFPGVTALSNGSYVVSSVFYQNGTIFRAGAITFATPVIKGAVSSENSVLGTTSNGGEVQTFSVDTVNGQLVVGRLRDNTVTLFRPDSSAYQVTLRGRILTSEGYGIRNARLIFTNSRGGVLPATTNSFGYYQRENILSGETYTITVTSKQYQFTPQIVNVTDGAANIDFVANP